MLRYTLLYKIISQIIYIFLLIYTVFEYEFIIYFHRKYILILLFFDLYWIKYLLYIIILSNKQIFLSYYFCFVYKEYEIS